MEGGPFPQPSSGDQVSNQPDRSPRGTAQRPQNAIAGAPAVPVDKDAQAGYACQNCCQAEQEDNYRPRPNLGQEHHQAAGQGDEKRQTGPAQ